MNYIELYSIIFPDDSPVGCHIFRPGQFLEQPVQMDPDLPMDQLYRRPVPMLKLRNSFRHRSAKRIQVQGWHQFITGVLEH